MRRWPLLAALLTFVAIAACPLDTTALCPGCIDTNRDNATCEWLGDGTFVLEPGNPAHHRHLVHDAHLAEGLAVRFADAEHGRRFGIEHHGGLVENGDVWRGCMSRMVARISTGHAVSSAQVQIARAERPGEFDVAVALLFMPLYVLASIVTGRAIARRFSADHRRVRLVATALASIVVSLLGCYAFVLWAMPWEGIRVGNGHIGGFRMASANRYSLSLPFVAGIPVFWLLALIHKRMPWNAVLIAATVSCSILAAMFARTFLTTVFGYGLASALLLTVVLAMGSLWHVDAPPEG